MVRAFVVIGITIIVLLISVFWMVRSLLFMPHPIAEAEHSLSEAELAQIKDELYHHIDSLATVIGERNVTNSYEKLIEAEAYLSHQLIGFGYEVMRQEFLTDGRPVANLIVTIPGSDLRGEVVVIGAHYDTAVGTPGANDNGSGVASLLSLARRFAGHMPRRTLKFVLFTNEEPPHFQTQDMGSFVYARMLAEDDVNVVAMLSLETMGYFTDEASTQHYPRPLDVFYPDSGNFIGFVGNFQSRHLLRSVVKTFRSHTRLSAEGAALPESLPGVGWSDHWSFWQFSYPAIMVTDTAPFRYPHYHRETDTIDKIDFDSLASATAGVHGVIADLAEARIAVR